MLAYAFRCGLRVTCDFADDVVILGSVRGVLTLIFVRVSLAAMSIIRAVKPIRTLAAGTAALFGIIAMSMLMVIQPAGAATHAASSQATPTAAQSCDTTGHPSNARCGTYMQMHGHVGQHTTARSCDNTGRSVVRTNNGGAEGKNYYTWDCVRLTHGEVAGRYTLNMYYELT